MLKFLKYIGQLILSPGNGWEDVSHAGYDPKSLASIGLYPLIGLASMTTFLGLLFDQESIVVTLLQQAIIVFVALFVTYFIAIAILGVLLQFLTEGEPNEKKYTTVITYSVALMAIAKLLENCIPINLPLLYFLYIYIALIIWKSVRYLAIKEKRVPYFVLMAIFSIIILPFIIEWVLSLIIL